MLRVTRVLLLVSSLSLVSGVDAQPLPPDQHTEEARLWLARAMVAEADWSRPDHAAIAWVLKRRWERRRAKDPSWTFLQQVRAYSAGVRGVPRTARHRWVHALRDDDEPNGWPGSVPWSAFQPRWAQVRHLVTLWFQGEVADPCRGQASHWGGPMDRFQGRTKPVNCGRTLNIFYQ